MADISTEDNNIIEEVLEIISGNVLNLGEYKKTSLKDFVQNAISKDIHDEKYDPGDDMARLRKLMKIESNNTVGTLLLAFYQYMKKDTWRSSKPIDIELERIAEKLKNKDNTDCIKDLYIQSDNEVFTATYEAIKQLIITNQPEQAIASLHTYFTTYIRDLLKKHNIEYKDDDTLMSIYKKYITYVEQNKRVETEMAQVALKYGASIIKAFNDVRNNNSTAHPNKLLGKAESMLIIENIAAAIKFIDTIET